MARFFVPLLYSLDIVFHREEFSLYKLAPLNSQYINTVRDSLNQSGGCYSLEVELIQQWYLTY